MRLFRFIACAAGLLCCTAAASSPIDRFRDLQILGRAVERQAPEATIRSTVDADTRFQTVELRPAQKAALTEALKSGPPVQSVSEPVLRVPVVDGDAPAGSLAVADNSLIAFPTVLREPGGGRNLVPYVRGITRYMFDRERQAFVAQIGIGITDLASPRRSEQLDNPISFRVLNAALVEPASVLVDRTNELKEVLVGVRSTVGANEIEVFSPDFADRRLAVGIKINPFISVEAADPEIDGLGLGSTKLIIRGIGLEDPTRHVVTLSVAGGGKLSEARFRLDEQGINEAELRSDFLEDAVITARSAGMLDDVEQVDVRFPWRTFASVLVGALFGALFRKRDGATRARHFAESFAAGLVTFVLYAGGWNLLNIPPLDAVGFVLAAIVGFAGGLAGPALVREAVGLGGRVLRKPEPPEGQDEGAAPSVP